MNNRKIQFIVRVVIKVRTIHSLHLNFRPLNDRHLHRVEDHADAIVCFDTMERKGVIIRIYCYYYYYCCCIIIIIIIRTSALT